MIVIFDIKKFWKDEVLEYNFQSFLYIAFAVKVVLSIYMLQVALIYLDFKYKLFEFDIF